MPSGEVSIFTVGSSLFLLEELSLLNWLSKHSNLLSASLISVHLFSDECAGFTSKKVRIAKRLQIDLIISGFDPFDWFPKARSILALVG